MNSEALEFFHKIEGYAPADISDILPEANINQAGDGSSAPEFCLGEQLQDIIAELNDCGAELLKLAKPPLTQRIRGQLEELGAKASRIAVVGQIKAGKSSFINAIVGRPDYLPTHVNPWTAVPTNLYFGVANRPQSGAYFEFFSADEWFRLGHGAGAAGGLDGPVENGERSDAERQMWRRAIMRIGSHFQQLLGMAHRYVTITPTELAHYLCAGPTIQAPSRQKQAGRYSDITKVAHVYLPRAPFAAPTILIDTPGLNDPSFIRINTTHAILEHADIYVVVLSASQPMSLADVVLLRRLRGLEKRRFLIFVNRADELPGGRADVEAVEAHVRARMASEFPEASVSIVSGSALWANAAIGGSDADIRDILGAERMRLFLAGGGEPAADADIAELRTRLFEASGVPALICALSDLMLDSFLSSDGLRLAEMLKSAAEFCGSTAAREITALQRMISRNGETADPISFDEALANLDRRLKEVDIVGRNAAAIVEDTTREIGEAQETHRAQIREEMQRLTRDFASDQRRQSLDSFKAQNLRHWRCDTTALIRELECGFIRLFTAALQDMEDIRKQCIATVRAYLEHSQTGGDEAAAEPAPPVQPDIRGALPALGKTIAIDIGRPWWSGWWRSEATPEDRAAELEEKILSEFLPVAEALAQLAAKELAGLGEGAAATLSDAVQSTVAATAARLADLKQRLAQHIELGKLRQLEMLDADYARSYRELKSLKTGCDAVIGRLRRIGARRVS